MKNLLYSLLTVLIITACGNDKEDMSSLRVESNCKECFERTVFIAASKDTLSDTTISKGKFCTEEEQSWYNGTTSAKDPAFQKYIIRSCKK
jgi:hypothetical protein